jgi:benzoyl-CoA reductase/2-hydroxyglutaryl-CoA dehydratase subunit BcrC/BadD/HgdB
MPRVDHNAALEALLARDLPKVSGKRVFLGGSAHETDTLYRMIEEAGGQVVGENHNWGQRIFEPGARATITFPQTASIGATLSRAEACGAQAAIWFVHADDAWQIWEAPDERAALAKAGMPCLTLNEQPYQIDEAAIASRIATFIESLA